MWFIWLPVILIITFVIFKYSNNDVQKPDESKSPLEVLKRRYANGEISDGEFENKRKKLK